MSDLILEFIKENSIIEEESVKIGLRQTDTRDYTLYINEELYDVPLIYFKIIDKDFIVGEFTAPFLEDADKGDYLRLDIEDYNMRIEIPITDMVKSNESNGYMFIGSEINYYMGA